MDFATAYYYYYTFHDLNILTKFWSLDTFYYYAHWIKTQIQENLANRYKSNFKYQKVTVVEPLYQNLQFCPNFYSRLA